MNNEDMDKIIEAEITDQIKTSIEYLSGLILDNSGVHRDYSDIELAYVVWIFTEVFMAKMSDWHEETPPDERKKIIIEAGKSIHQTIERFTGLDLHKVQARK